MSQEEGRCREGARGGAAPARGGVGERGGALRSTGAGQQPAGVRGRCCRDRALRCRPGVAARL